MYVNNLDFYSGFLEGSYIGKINFQQDNDNINGNESSRKIKSVSQYIKAPYREKREIRPSKKFIRSIIETSDEIKGHDERVAFVPMHSERAIYPHCRYLNEFSSPKNVRSQEKLV